MTISVATPSFKQLDWLRLCVASVRDQVVATQIDGMLDTISESRIQLQRIPHSGNDRAFHPEPIIPPLAVEHIIQDAGSPGIEDFAREVGADFYRDGTLISHSRLQIPNYSLAIYLEHDDGMYDAINRAWEKSNGELLCYLNCDEQYLPSAIARVAKEFEENPRVDIIFGDAVVADVTGRPLSYRRIVRPSPAHTRIVHLGTMSCAMFFQRGLFDRGLHFDTQWKAIGDAEWVFHALENRANIRMVSEPLAAFTLTGNNLGANQKALAEAAQWRSSAPPLHRKLALFWKAQHFAKKLIAGAYRSRRLKVSLYNSSSPKERVGFEHDRLSYRWPCGT